MGNGTWQYSKKEFRSFQLGQKQFVGKRKISNTFFKRKCIAITPDYNTGEAKALP